MRFLSFITTIFISVFGLSSCSNSDEINKNNDFTITWKNYDGSILEIDNHVKYLETPIYDGLTPKRESDSNYSYTFYGWDKTIEPTKSDQIYTAVYTSTKVFGKNDIIDKLKGVGGTKTYSYDNTNNDFKYLSICKFTYSKSNDMFNIIGNINQTGLKESITVIINYELNFSWGNFKNATGNAFIGYSTSNPFTINETISIISLGICPTIASFFYSLTNITGSPTQTFINVYNDILLKKINSDLFSVNDFTKSINSVLTLW